MKRCVFVFFSLMPLLGLGQKVAVVFSGGGAKGLAHLGVLKALEANEIPIDCIIGTSMGGIVAGCYAAGMSPDQIEEMILSEDFLRWVNGQSEKGYNYFYHKSDDSPGFLKLNLAVDSTLNLQLNATLASDVSLNFALTEKMAQASAISKGNFDSLFIPLRVMASDIFTQNQVILANGSLSDALRATQTVPFFYTPIRVDGKYLFDGGIYNNFPVDVAEREFHPEVVIGSNVSTKIFDEYPYNKDDELIGNSLLYMLLDKSDPKDIQENGVYIQPNLSSYSAFDFNKVKNLIDSGYRQTMRQMDDIKKKIQQRRPCDVVMQRRNVFNNRNYPLLFSGLSYKGYNAKQRKYIDRVFHIKPKVEQTIFFSDIKKNYFRLVSERYFGNTYPNILFDQLKQKFSLQLTRRPQKNFEVDFGGVIATRDVSNIFLGFNYYDFGNGLLHVYAGFQTGNFYRSAFAQARIDFPYQFYLEPEVVYNGWNYLGSNDILQDNKPTILKRIDRSLSLTFGMPVGSKFRSSIGLKGINNIDRYGDRDIFISSDTLDELRLTGYRAKADISRNSLNRKQYATEGSAFSLAINYFNVTEYYLPGNTSSQTKEATTMHQWVRLKIMAEQYFKFGWFNLGYCAETAISNQPFFQNYNGTIINASAFLPLQDSRTLLLQNFRAFNYGAFGVRNIISLYKKLDLRVEGYVFKPLEYLQMADDQKTISTTDLRSVFFAGTAGFVVHSPIGPISLSLNYYDDAENQFGVLLHAGYLLFNKHNIDQ